jgi:hypothetical protein
MEGKFSIAAKGKIKVEAQNVELIATEGLDLSGGNTSLEGKVGKVNGGGSAAIEGATTKVN